MREECRPNRVRTPSCSWFTASTHRRFWHDQRMRVQERLFGQHPLALVHWLSIVRLLVRSAIMLGVVIWQAQLNRSAKS